MYEQLIVATWNNLRFEESFDQSELSIKRSEMSIFV